MVKTVMKSFFAASDRELKSSHLKIRKVSKTRRTYDRIVPTKDQVYSMTDAATSLRDKAIVLTLWQSGLRNRTLRNLTIGHVRDGILNNEVPIKIDVTPDIDKKTLREPYYTFIDLDAIEAIRRYLRTRGAIADLDEGQPLFLSNLKMGGGKRKMTGESIRRVIKNAARNAGMNPQSIWPHCLRSAFYNMLVGKVDDVQREFMFGHEMGVRSHYFAPQRVEKLKSAYSGVRWRRAAIALTKEDIRAEVIGAMMGKISDAELAPVARKLGITPQQIRALIRRVRGEAELEKGETEALLEHERKQKTATNGGYHNNHYEYKILAEKELCQHLKEGWDLVKEMSNGKLLVRRES